LLGKSASSVVPHPNEFDISEVKCEFSFLLVPIEMKTRALRGSEPMKRSNRAFESEKI